MSSNSKHPNDNMKLPKLSICIATYNRGLFIGETLDSILGQIVSDVELVIVDGASPDNTPQVMAQYLSHYPEIRYFREQENSGVDADYDKAVGYARGEYATKDGEVFFSDVANYLSFIGGVVIKRNLWMERDRSSYYGTLFIHVGVIFQHPPINKVKVIADPLIIIRYGNAMWTSRRFEIWMFKWPQLIWSFPDFSDQSKSVACCKEPWRQIKKLILYRAIGGYSLSEYSLFMAGRTKGLSRGMYMAIAMFPATLANFFASLYWVCVNRNARSGLYDLSRSRHSTWASRFLARFL